MHISPKETNPQTNIASIQNSQSQTPQIVPRKSNRNKIERHRDNNFYYYDDAGYEAANFNTNHSLQKHLSFHRLNKKHKNLIEQITQNNVPKNYNNDSKDPKWVETMNQAMEALKTNNTSFGHN